MLGDAAGGVVVVVAEGDVPCVGGGAGGDVRGVRGGDREGAPELVVGVAGAHGVAVGAVVGPAAGADGAGSAGAVAVGVVGHVEPGAVVVGVEVVGADLAWCRRCGGVAGLQGLPAGAAGAVGDGAQPPGHVVGVGAVVGVGVPDIGGAVVVGAVAIGVGAGERVPVRGPGAFDPAGDVVVLGPAEPVPGADAGGGGAVFGGGGVGRHAG
ncbi:MAG: hypothetical protein ACRDRH_26400 [Pseudonocardia sp.]